MKKIIIGLLFVCAFLFCAYFFSNSNSCENWIKENETNLTFNGKVVSKFLDINEKNQPRVILDDGVKYSLGNINVYNQVEVGNILIKKSGGLRRLLIKGNDSIYYYEMCDGAEVK